MYEFLFRWTTVMTLLSPAVRFRYCMRNHTPPVSTYESLESVHRSRSSRDIPTQLHVSDSPYKCVLGRGLFGASQDTNVTNGCLGGVTRNKLDAKSPLPEGLLL